MEPGANFQKRANGAPVPNRSCRRLRNPGEYLEEGAFAGAILPDQGNSLAGHDFERNISQRPEIMNRCAAAHANLSCVIANRIDQAAITSRSSKQISLRKPANLNCRDRHMRSAKLLSIRRKTSSPQNS